MKTLIAVVSIVVILCALYFVGIAIVALLFKWAWNGFVVSHLAGATRTSWTAALLPGILLSWIASCGFAGSRSTS